MNSVCNDYYNYHTCTGWLGDLCDMVQLGDEYTVIGIPVYECVPIDGRTTIKTTLEVHYIKWLLNDQSICLGIG